MVLTRKQTHTANQNPYIMDSGDLYVGEIDLPPDFECKSIIFENKQYYTDDLLLAYQAIKELFKYEDSLVNDDPSNYEIVHAINDLAIQNNNNLVISFEKNCLVTLIHNLAQN